VTTNPVTVLAVSTDETINGSNALTAYWPYAVVYAAAGTDGNVHLYSLNLTNASSSVPTPVQVGSLSLSSVSKLCDFNQLQSNLLNPTTMIIVLHIAGLSGCNTTGDVWESVNLTDSVSTAPVPLSITTTSFTPLYQQSGALGGVVLLDNLNDILYFYPNATFTAPNPLVMGVSSNSDVVTYSFSSTGAYLGTTLFESVTKTGVSSLWRITPAGSATAVYTAAGSMPAGIADGTNIYFLDVGASSETVWQATAAGGTPVAISTAISGGGYLLDGSNSAVVVLHSNGSGLQGKLAYLQVSPGGPEAPTPIGGDSGVTGTYKGSIRVFITAPAIGEYSSDNLFVTDTIITSNGGTPSTSYATQILTPTGGPIVPATANMATANAVFLGEGTLLSGTMLEVTGITDTTGSYGGGNIFNVNEATPTSPGLEFVVAGGTDYVVPAGDLVASFGISSSYAAGDLFNTTSGTAPAGLVLNVNQDTMSSISLTGTSITSVY
jgi:hypothetical protein